MSVQGEYEKLVEKIVSFERVNVASAKKAITEILDERYGGCPNALRYRAFTELPPAEIAKVKKYLRVYFDSNRFRQDFPEIAWLISGA